MGELVPLDQLRKRRYGQIICYPGCSRDELKRRLGEMKALDVEAIELVGESRIADLPLLGKGCAGIVLLAHTKSGKVALKIRRTDADRSATTREARLLKMANSVGVGPKYVAVTENLLAMEFVQGTPFPKWISCAIEREAKIRVRHILLDLMDQSWRLDELGLDHGELSRASKHIIVTPIDRAHILDFESASLHRRVSNVTSLCHYLLLRGVVAGAVEEKLGGFEKGDLIALLRRYKNDRSREKFEEIPRICGI